MFGFSALIREKPQRFASNFNSINCSSDTTAAGNAP